MLAKLEKFNELLDLYGNLLTPRQMEVMSLYYHEDWSYQEIADELEISKSAVYDIIKRVSNNLVETEEKIGFLNYRNRIKQALEDLPDKSLNDISDALEQLKKEI